MRPKRVNIREGEEGNSFARRGEGQNISFLRPARALLLNIQIPPILSLSALTLLWLSHIIIRICWHSAQSLGFSVGECHIAIEPNVYSQERTLLSARSVPRAPWSS